MRSIVALIRASFMSAASYRLSMALSLLSMFVTILPLYFASAAIQSIAAASIQSQSPYYFSFVVIGTAALLLATNAVGAVGGAIGGTISSGTLEALLVTRTPLAQTLIGIGGYGILWSGLRAFLLVVSLAVMGYDVAWSAMGSAVLVVTLLVAAYYGIGIIAAGLILVFRTSGPLTTIVITGSGLFGGTYFTAQVIPAPFNQISKIIPLTYANDALRQLLTNGASLADVKDQVLMLGGMSFFLLAVSTLFFMVAFRYARRAGTLSQY